MRYAHCALHSDNAFINLSHEAVLCDGANELFYGSI